MHLNIAGGVTDNKNTQCDPEGRLSANDVITNLNQYFKHKNPPHVHMSMSGNKMEVHHGH